MWRKSLVRCFAVASVLLLAVFGILLRNKALAAPRLQNIDVPVLPVDGRFVTATQDSRYMYLYYQTEGGLRIFQLDVSRIQSLGNQVHLVGIMNVRTVSPLSQPGPPGRSR